MNHPSREELVDFLDEELPHQRQAEVAEHVLACDECGRQTASWRAARTALAAWQLPTFPQAASRPSHRAARRGAWPRAAAGAALVAAGFGLALLSAPRSDTASVRSELAREIRRHLREEVHAELAKFTASQHVQQESFLRDVAERLDQLELQWMADYAALRRDVETVAIGTQEGLRRLASAEPIQQDVP